MKRKKQIKAGVVGYGPTCNMGRNHLQAMAKHGGFVPSAVCDIGKDRLALAREEFPGIETHDNLGAMLRKSEVELVAILLPHHLHAKAATRCLNAGRHVVVEKPFAITVEECDRVIAAARKNKRMLSVFHNRHWDPNILTIRKHLKKIGRPFRWESFVGGFSKPRAQWRSNKKMSGGILYDWGAHFIEWMLQVIDDEMVEICGYGLREVWTETTNEDEMEAVVRFRHNAVGSFMQSSVAATGKPMIRICGTKGSIIADHDTVTIHATDKRSNQIATTAPLETHTQEHTHEKYYANIWDHLLKGEPLAITPEWARRVIQVIDYACRSAKAGKALRPKYP